MGVFSWTCPHCEHSIISHNHADPGINDWMVEAAVLTPKGSTIVGTYGGYGDVDGYEITDDMEDGAVMVHRACWEVAGKPDFSHYPEQEGQGGGLRSLHAADQGFFFDDQHDFIDPRITDSAERERLLTEGRVARTQARYDQKALDALEMVADAQEKEPEDRWQARFGLMGPAGRVTDYLVCDNVLKEHFIHAPTREEAESTARRLWEQGLETPEFKALLDRGCELRDIDKARYEAEVSS